jgi:hypothetical protein
MLRQLQAINRCTHTNPEARSNRSIAALRSPRGPVRSKRSIALLRSKRLRQLGLGEELARFENSQNVKRFSHHRVVAAGLPPAGDTLRS